MRARARPSHQVCERRQTSVSIGHGEGQRPDVDKASAKFDPDSPRLAQTCPGTAQTWPRPRSARNPPNLTTVGPESTQIGPESTELCPASSNTGSESTKVCPNLTKSGAASAICILERLWSSSPCIGAARPRIDPRSSRGRPQTQPMYGALLTYTHMWPMPSQVWPIPCRNEPLFVECGPESVDLGAVWPMQCQIGRLGPTLSLKFGHVWPDLDRIRPASAAARPKPPLIRLDRHVVDGAWPSRERHVSVA